MTRDEIINGLEREVKSIRMEPQSKMLGVCITVDEAEDIVALLKEDEPRVLTADELYLMEHKCVYLERRNSQVYSTEPSIVVGTNSFALHQYKYLLMRENKISDVRYSSDYNKETKSGWRCWSVKPTEERRKEVKWE